MKFSIERKMEGINILLVKGLRSECWLDNTVIHWFIPPDIVLRRFGGVTAIGEGSRREWTSNCTLHIFADREGSSQNRFKGFLKPARFTKLHYIDESQYMKGYRT